MKIITVQPESIFQALADETRLRIIRLIVTTNEEACLCELVDSLQESTYKLSRHLKILRQAGLLSAQKDGRWVYHRLVSKLSTLKHCMRQFMRCRIQIRSIKQMLNALSSVCAYAKMGVAGWASCPMT